jgi:hypothetical protein
LKVGYPVAIDSDYRIWEAFANQYWPALYFIDAKGHIRHHYFGEGQYAEAERVLQQLLKESGASGLDESVVRVAGQGVEAAPSEPSRPRKPTSATVGARASLRRSGRPGTPPGRTACPSGSV